MCDILNDLNGMIWGKVLIILIPLVGIIYSIRLKFIQIRYLKAGLREAFKGENNGEGEISSFSALCTMLGATIGTGNIVGVAAAVCTGGAGALFWMEISAILGMATKYAEGVLAIKFREKQNGKYIGGPFYYIEKGLGRKWKWLAKTFCIFAILAGVFGIGTLTQINSITEALQSFFDPRKEEIIFGFFGNEYTFSAVIGGGIVTLLTAFLIFGGIKRIARFSELLVPAMSVIYIALTLMIILNHLPKIPEALVFIVKSAFSTTSLGGAAVGINVKTALTVGFSKGIFSNEAGLGSSAIGAAATKTCEPVCGGLVSMISAFIDTTVLCTLSGLAVVLSDSLAYGGNGVAVTIEAWNTGLPFNKNISSFFLSFSLVFFAFATIPGWSYYCESCLNYLTSGSVRATKTFRIVYIAVVGIAPYVSFNTVWLIADFLNGLMALPNLLALALLGGTVSRETARFFARNQTANKSKYNKIS